MASRVSVGCFLHLVIQVSDDLQVQCETSSTVPRIFALMYRGPLLMCGLVVDVFNECHYYVLIAN